VSKQTQQKCKTVDDYQWIARVATRLVWSVAEVDFLSALWVMTPEIRAAVDILIMAWALQYAFSSLLQSQHHPQPGLRTTFLQGSSAIELTRVPAILRKLA
jgi:hypothetical protein